MLTSSADFFANPNSQPSSSNALRSQLHMSNQRTTSMSCSERQRSGQPTFRAASCPRGSLSSYGHLAAFVHGANATQQAALWANVASTLRREIQRKGEASTWLNTEGSGVPWLHVRLDSMPKYYHHHSYRDPNYYHTNVQPPSSSKGVGAVPM